MKKRLRKKACFAVVAIVAAMVLGGCGGSEKVDPTSTTNTSPSATETTPAWQANYTAPELAAYKAGLARFRSYEQASEPIWAAGRATGSAKKLFQSYFIPWQSQWAVLKQYESAEIRTEGLPRVLSAKASRIKIDGTSADVVIEQCVDFTTARVTQRDKEIAPITEKPQIRDVDMNYVDGKWLIFEVTNAEGGDRPCSG